MSEPGFCLESLIEAAKQGFSAPGSEEWMHLSPGVWTRLAGFGLGCFNVGAAVGTIGLATPFAVASVATGAVAVTAG